jgi:hypothetical protein
MSYETLIERQELLHRIAKDYVLKGLGGKILQSFTTMIALINSNTGNS